jgi:hypothetical protein
MESCLNGGWRRPVWISVIAVGIVVILALASIGLVNVLAESDGPNTEHDRVFADFSSPQLRVTNDGTPLAVLDSGRNVSGLAVVNSELTHGFPKQSNAAGYLEARIDAPVSRIGAVAEFHSENSGAIGLVSSSESIADASGKGARDSLPNGGILFASTNRQWHFGVWDSAAKREHVLLHGTLALAADGTGQAFEVVRYGDTVTVRLPDGTMQATADSRIAQWTGPWANWQLYEFDTGQVPATLTAVWAS